MTPTKKLAEIVLARDEAVEAYQEKLARIVCHHHESLGKLLDALPQIKADALAQLVPDLTSRLDSTIPQMVAALAEAARDELVTDQSARLSILAEDAQRTRDDIAKFLAEGEARVDGKLAALNDHSKKLIENAEIAAEVAAQVAVQERLSDPNLKQFVEGVIASQPQPDPQPAPASSENVLVGLFKGWFTPGDDAKRGELWVYNGSTYLCTADTDMPPMPGPIDTEIENWAMFAAAGRPGAPGTSSTTSGGGSSLPDQTGNNGKFLTTDGATASWGTPAGSGDMVLASVQTVTGAKTFNDAKLLLRNVADTFSSWFTNAATAARTWTLPNASGTIALTSDITGTNSGTNTGDQTITLTGDVTGSGQGTFAATIAAGAVTLAKMANMATASVFYRKTAGSGAPEVQTLATLKTDLAVTASDVGLGSVTNDAQTKAAIVPNTAPAAGKILVGNAGGTAYAPVSMGTDATMDSAGAVTIANAAVTLAKMANMATASVIYRKTAGSGAPEVNTLATLKTDLALAVGDLAAGALASGSTATTQAVRENSTKVATTAYADRAALTGNAAQTLTGTTSTTIDWSLGNNFTLTLGGNLGTVTFSNTTDGQQITVALTNTASNYTVTWGNSIKWVGGSQPVQTIGAKTDIWTIIKLGTTYYGSVVQNLS